MVTGSNDWEKKNKYTDDSTINALKPNLIKSSIVEYALGDDTEHAPSTG